jgi:uncharacterized membrane-anchored protein YitT (DUF2179 family)
MRKKSIWKKFLGAGFWHRLMQIPALAYPEKTFRHGKAIIRLGIIIRQNLRDFFLLSLGVFMAGFGLKGFLLPSGFIDGGAVGLSLLLAGKFKISISILLVLINIPFVYLGLKNIGKEFAVKTAMGIIGLALATAFIEFPVITADKLLVSVFGGFFIGAGIGLSMRGGGVLDGTEVLAVQLSKPMGLSIGDLVLVINIVIFSLAAWLLSMETAMYSILTYLSASKTVDFLIEGIEEYTGVTIISVKSEEIRMAITEKLGRGVTIYKGERGFRQGVQENRELNILFTVVTRLEVNKLSQEIEKADPSAFVVMHSIKDTRGGMIRKRPLQH